MEISWNTLVVRESLAITQKNINMNKKSFDEVIGSGGLTRDDVVEVADDNDNDAQLQLEYGVERSTLPLYSYGEEGTVKKEGYCVLDLDGDNRIYIVYRRCGPMRRFPTRWVMANLNGKRRHVVFESNRFCGINTFGRDEDSEDFDRAGAAAFSAKHKMPSRYRWGQDTCRLPQGKKQKIIR